jgi:hypothetical protein
MVGMSEMKGTCIFKSHIIQLSSIFSHLRMQYVKSSKMKFGFPSFEIEV